MNSARTTLKRCARLLTPAVLCAAALAGCGAIHGTAMRANGACIAFSPITFSASRDTGETIAQVRGHNAAWDAVCEVRK